MNQIKSVKYRLDKEKLKEYHSKGLSCREIGRLLGCSFPTISTALKEVGLQVKTNVEAVRRYTINQNYFETIDNHNKAYFLGFIAADGYVNNSYQQLRITLHKDDVEVLNNLKIAMEAQTPVKIRPMKNAAGVAVDRADLQVVNKKVVDDLNRLGIVQKKSLVLEFPSINTQFYAAFMRGYFDGDGSVHSPDCFDVCGTSKLLVRYQEILMEKCQLGLTKLDRRGSISCLHYNGRHQLKRIFDFLYSDDGYKLTRKYNKFIALTTI